MRIPASTVGEGGSGAGARFGRKEQFLEVLVFLFLIVPSMCVSFFAIRRGAVGFVVTAVATILRDLALISLVIFLLWRNREPLSRIGWNLQKHVPDVIRGMILFPFLFFGAAYLDRLLLAAGLSQPSTPLPRSLAARGPNEFLLAFLLVIVVAIAEETIFRGYLILRLTSVTHSTAAAVVLSSVIFSLGHGYEGTAGVITVGFMGLAFALVYIWTESLVAPIVMHFLQDLITVVLLPLLGHR